MLIDGGKMCLEPVQCARFQRRLLCETTITARTPPLDPAQPVLNLPSPNTRGGPVTEVRTDQVETLRRIALILEQIGPTLNVFEVVIA